MNRLTGLPRIEGTDLYEYSVFSFVCSVLCSVRPCFLPFFFWNAREIGKLGLEAHEPIPKSEAMPRQRKSIKRSLVGLHCITHPTSPPSSLSPPPPPSSPNCNAHPHY